MKLSRFTPANKIEIKYPIWHNRSIGIATYKVGQHNEITILKKDANGKLYYPLPLYISGENARKYPIEPVKSNKNIKLYIIPIADLEELIRE